mgnify:CR=1 FL=1
MLSISESVYEDFIISTIVDYKSQTLSTQVYEDFIISTIVDGNGIVPIGYVSMRT